jgi:hypothetical protein
LVRIAAAGGWSAPKVLCVDDLPEVRSAATNTQRGLAQDIDLPCAVVGALAAETGQFFRFRLAQPGRVTFDALARRLGSPLDPALFVTDAAGREVRGGGRDDAPGLQGDCRLDLELPPGEFCVEIRDGTWRGGRDFTYRLRLGELPLVAATIPMAVQRGVPGVLRFAGAGCAALPPVVAVADAGAVAFALAPTDRPAWPAFVLVSDHPESAELEPNDSTSLANELTIPGGVTGQFMTRSDRDWYRLRCTKGERIRFRAWAAEVGSPADVLLTVRDSAGKELAGIDPAKLTPRLDWVAPGDGTFFLVAEHVNYEHGPEQVYRITATRAEEFEVALQSLTAAVPAGGATEIKVHVTRTGYDGPLTLEVTGDVGFTGSMAVPAKQAGDVSVPLRAAAGLAPGVSTVRIVGKATIDGRPYCTTALGRAPLKAVLHGLEHPPPDWAAAIGVAILPPTEPKP